MKNLDQIIEELEILVTKNLDKYKFPEINGKNIRIGKILIRPSKKYGYVIFDVEQNKSLETVYSKSAAIAYALSYQKKRNSRNILFYDSIIKKNTDDSQFYYHIMSNTDEQARRETMLNRLEESKHKIDWAKNALDEYIMNDIR
jgi:hypothetical protein